MESSLVTVPTTRITGFVRHISKKCTLTSPSCLCQAVRPVILLCQFTGVLPLSFNSAESKLKEGLIREEPSHICSLAYRRLSWPSFVSVVYAIVYFLPLMWIHSNMLDVLKVFFKGRSDLYAMYFKVFALNYEVLFIILMARAKSGSFVRAWTQIMEIQNILQDSNRHLPLRRIKFQVWSLLGLVGVANLGFAQVVVTKVILPCLTGTNENGMDCSLWTGYFLQKMTSSFSETFYQSFGVLFLVNCWIIRALNGELAEWLQQELAQKSNRISDVRQLHEKLCTAITSASDYFGFQALAIVCCILLSVILNVYKLILIGPLLEGADSVRSFFVIWSMHLYFGVFTLIVSFMSGQIVKNLGSLLRTVIHRANYLTCDEAVKFEISLLLDQVKNMPKITASGIADIGMGMVGSAIMSVATYLLVLFQFHLSFAGDKAA